MWNSIIPERRWAGFRRSYKGVTAFHSLNDFEKAALNELNEALQEHELSTLGRLLERGKKQELEIFVRTHGANPLFDPHRELEIKVGVAKADVVSLSDSPSPEAIQRILDGDIVHVLFQAGEASRFDEGPFYTLNPYSLAQNQAPADSFLGQIEIRKKSLPPVVSNLLLEWPLGPKQPLLIRAALRRIVQREVDSGNLSIKEGMGRYQEAIANQKIIFFVSQKNNVAHQHDDYLRQRHGFYGFNPENVVTIVQELSHGLSVNEKGEPILLEGEESLDAAGHLYALIQAARMGDFTTYTESGRPIKPMELDALSYLSGRGGKILSIVRINDMDRHTTEIINSKALSYALQLFADGYANAIETVANPDGQKGGTGTTFGDPSVHMLTETHENSFPSLSRAFESAMKQYLQENNDQHPAYNAMRQWADLGATRHVLREYGGRIVFVPRQRVHNGKEYFYLGVDMPMGDLSLLSEYKSRMFQFQDNRGHELLIHDMKKKEHLPLALHSLLRQMTDPAILAATEELASNQFLPFKKGNLESDLYGAPAEEFEGKKI